MRPYDLLSDWLNHDLAGPYAREVLALAGRYGRPQVPTGMGEDVPAPFELPDSKGLVDTPDAFMTAVRLESVVRVLHCAVDYHGFPNKRIFFVMKPFAKVPSWYDGEVVIDANWLPFQREALEVVQRFMDELASRGLIRYAVCEPGSLTA